MLLMSGGRRVRDSRRVDAGDDSRPGGPDIKIEGCEAADCPVDVKHGKCIIENVPTSFEVILFGSWFLECLI